VCDVKARGRELRVMSAGVGAVSVRLLELCLWVGLSGGLLGCRDAAKDVAGWLGRRPWRPGGGPAPLPARHMLSAYPRVCP
jgi:hypothetical protein